MTHLRLNIVLSLTALLSGGLALPNSASAEERLSEDASAHYGERQQSQPHQGDNWYLLRHREARPYGYRTIEVPPTLHHLKHQQRAVAPAIGETIVL